MIQICKRPLKRTVILTAQIVLLKLVFCCCCCFKINLLCVWTMLQNTSDNFVSLSFNLHIFIFQFQEKKKFKIRNALTFIPQPRHQRAVLGTTTQWRHKDRSRCAYAPCQFTDLQMIDPGDIGWLDFYVNNKNPKVVRVHWITGR